MKLKRLFFILCAGLVLTGCAHASLLSQGTKEDTWADSGYITVGHHLTVQNTDNRMDLLENMDVLSADGLYYATFTMGSSEPYENADGDTVDLYDAQLYLLLGEFKDSQDARNNMDMWLTSGKSNYEVLSEEEVICNGQSYSLITYNCTSDSNPFERGVSAFGATECDGTGTAVCIELTCRENFKDDLKTILIHFLDNCTYDSK